MQPSVFSLLTSVFGAGRDRGRRDSLGNAALFTAVAGALAYAHLAERSESVPEAPPCGGKIILTQIPLPSLADDPDQIGGGLVGRDLPTGSRIVEVDLAPGDNPVKTLTDGFAAAGRADLSFDGTHILFVARRDAGEKNAVWEMRLADGEVRQVVTPPVGCEAVIYLSTLYTLEAGQPVRQIAFCGPESAGGPNQFFTCRTDGSNVRQITFAPEGVSDPYLLTDGRLLFSMGLPPDPALANESPASNRALFTINVDGTDISPFAGVGDGPAWRRRPFEAPDNRVYFLESDAAQPSPGGSLVAVRRTKSLHSRRVIASSPDGHFHSASALEDGRLLVSYRSGADRVHASYGLYILQPDTGEFSGRMVDEPAWHEVDPVVVRPRPVPRGRSSVVNPNSNVGQLYCLDLGLSDESGDPPTTDRRVAGVRVFSQNSGGGVLGTALVESDGSFFLEVPARTPIRFETLDDRGEVVRAMRSWMWIMPAERRGCIGCHEDRELTPPNRHVLALRKAPQRIGVSSRPALPVGGENP